MEEVSGLGTLEEVIKRIYGSSASLENKKRVSGGDINDAFLLTVSDGACVFLKENKIENQNFFKCESDGLSAIRDTRTIPVPEVIAIGTYGDRAFLLMEYIKPGRPVDNFFEDFGHKLAVFHAAASDSYTSEKKFGFYEDNYIGAGRQVNTCCDSWIDFFRDFRLIPQIEMAKGRLPAEDIKALDQLLSHMDKYLIEPDHPSLLHGDLWSGNYIVGCDGKVVLIDPAVYVGNPEADIAMTQLFGGFSGRFYEAYMDSGLIKEGYNERRDVYNLYHMLNHLNLFGEPYLYEVESLLRSILK